MKDSLIFYFDRDLTKLKNELKSYKEEADIWKIQDGISNSAGTLAIHLIGNLNHYIGANMGNTGYERDKEGEFTLRDIPLEEILMQIEETRQVITKALLEFPEDWFYRKYPLEEFGYPMTYEYFMTHLVGHLNYHLGQINYHRRLLTTDN